MDCSLPGSPVHGILHARILEWVVMPSSRGSSQPRDQTLVSYSSCIVGKFFLAETPGKPAIDICSVQLLSCVQLFVTLWTEACQASLSIINFWSLLKLMSSVSYAIQPSHPLSAPSPPAFNLSQDQGLFQGVSSSH